jgi:hypothetical protein
VDPALSDGQDAQTAQELSILGGTIVLMSCSSPCAAWLRLNGFENVEDCFGMSGVGMSKAGI